MILTRRQASHEQVTKMVTHVQRVLHFLSCFYLRDDYEGLWTKVGSSRSIQVQSRKGRRRHRSPIRSNSSATACHSLRGGRPRNV